MSERISASEFARRMSVSTPAVTKALSKGRITGEKIRGKWYLDPDGAAQEWVANSRYRIEAAGARELQKTVKAIPKRAIVDSRALKEEYDAKLAQLKYEKAAGELVPAAEVQAAWCSIIAIARTRLLAVPSNAKIRIPSLTAAHVEILEELMREALERLSEEGVQDDDGT